MGKHFKLPSSWYWICTGRHFPLSLGHSSDTSGFLFRKTKQNWVQAQVNYPGFTLVRTINLSSLALMERLPSRATLNWETQILRSFIDGCLLYGVKASLGGGLIVSSAKAEVGLKIPFMFVGQNYTKPSNTSLTEPSPFLLMASLYSRWPFQQWFVQTEFSKIVGNDLTLFSLGAGYKF